MSRTTALMVPVFLASALGCSEGDPDTVSVTPALRDVETALVTSGQVDPFSRAGVRSEQSGQVRVVTVERGDAVERGQVLVRLADAGQSDERARSEAHLAAARARLAALRSGIEPGQKAQLEASLRGAESALRSAIQEEGRLARLAEAGAIAASVANQARRKASVLRAEVEGIRGRLQAPVASGRERELAAQVREAQASLRQSSRAVDGLTIRAPRDGILYGLDVAEGDHLRAGDAVAMIGDLASVRVRIQVDEPDLGRIDLGSTAVLTTDSAPGREWPCTVDRLATEVVAVGRRRVGEVLCTADNTDGRLLPNLAVGVRVVTERAERSLSLPREVVNEGADGAWVWLLRGGRAERRLVRLGTTGTRYVVIESGLQETDTVLRARSGTLAVGRRVTVEGDIGSP